MQISVDVKHPHRLLMIPDHAKHQEPPRKPDDGPDWERITAVIITEIADTH
jgi:hypothetical protein